MKNLQTMKHNVQKGFTLIELMIVVAIIGILAALAIPAYSDYTIRAKVSEAASLSGAIKAASEIYWSENQELATGAAGTNSGYTSLGVASNFSGNYAESVKLGTGGVITIVITNINTSINGSNVTYTPDTGQANIKWSVGGSVDTKYLPKV